MMRLNHDWKKDKLITQILENVMLSTSVRQLMDRNLYPFVKHVLPRIILDTSSGCWIWVGMKQTQHNVPYPILNAPKDRTISRGTKRMHVTQFVARLFWSFPADYVVYLQCKNPLCVNPNHFELSPRGNAFYRD